MFIRLLVLFSIVPLIEIYVLLQVGSLIGLFPTLSLILLTGIAGTYLARTQGLDLLRRIQTEMSCGRVPAEELIDGAMVLIGGVLLLTPGFCTDLFGFCLLVPFTRNFLKRTTRASIQRMLDKGQINIHRF